jgi:hypothetical protein
MATKLTEYEVEDVRILRIIRANPGLDAVSLQAHGLVPRDAGRLGDLKARGRVDFKSGGWYLTSQGDLFLLQRWEGPVLTPDQKRHVAMLGGDPAAVEQPAIGASPQSRRPDAVDPKALRPTIKAERPVGFVRQAGAGKIDFRQAGHPGNDGALLKDGWHPVFWGADDV